MKKEFDRQALTIIQSPGCIGDYLNGVGDIYVKNGWGDGYDENMLRKMFLSAHYVVVIHSGLVISVARALTDDVCVTHFSEILVHPDYQRSGVAQLMVECVLKCLSHTYIYAEALTDIAARLLENNGFKRKPQLQVYVKAGYSTS